MSNVQLRKVKTQNDVVNMSAAARIPPLMAVAPPCGERAPEDGARPVEDAQYDAILSAYQQASDPKSGEWAAQCLVKVMRAMDPAAPRSEEIAQNCILLVLALFSPNKDGAELPGTDIHQLPRRAQREIQVLFQDLWIA